MTHYFKYLSRNWSYRTFLISCFLCLLWGGSLKSKEPVSWRDLLYSVLGSPAHLPKLQSYSNKARTSCSQWPSVFRTSNATSSSAYQHRSGDDIAERFFIFTWVPDNGHFSFWPLPPKFGFPKVSFRVYFAYVTEVAFYVRLVSISKVTCRRQRSDQKSDWWEWCYRLLNEHRSSPI